MSEWFFEQMRLQAQQEEANAPWFLRQIREQTARLSGMNSAESAINAHLDSVLGTKWWRKWRSIDPKKQMTDQQARLLIVGGLRP